MFSILYWRFLRYSKIFNYWYKKHLTDVIYDIEISGFDPSIKQKYINKLKTLS
jgi:hypothetical protein